MAAFPVRILAIEILEFGDGAIEIFFVAERISEVIADAGFVRLEALGGAIFRDGLIQLALIVQNDAKIAVRLPEIGAQAEGMAIGDGGAAQVALIAMRDSNVEVDIGVGGGIGRFARERFVEGVEGGIVVAVGVGRESEVAIGLGVCGIDAQRGTRFGESVFGIVVR